MCCLSRKVRELTDQTLVDIATFAESLEGVERTYALAGTGSLVSASPSQGGDHWGKLNLVVSNDVSQSQINDIQTQLRRFVNRIPGLESTLAYPELFTFAAPIQVELMGYDLNGLQTHGENIAQLLKDNDRFSDITT